MCGTRGRKVNDIGGVTKKKKIIWDTKWSQWKSKKYLLVEENERHINFVRAFYKVNPDLHEVRLSDCMASLSSLIPDLFSSGTVFASCEVSHCGNPYSYCRVLKHVTCPCEMFKQQLYGRPYFFSFLSTAHSFSATRISSRVFKTFITLLLSFPFFLLLQPLFALPPISP